MMRRRNGFTIIEMLVVIAILAVLLGIVGTAATAAVRNARVKRGNAMKRAWQGAITSYYAQKGEWPGALESIAKSSNKTIVDLNDGELNQVFQAVAKQSMEQANPLIDVSALYVCRNSSVIGCNDLHGENCPHNELDAEFHPNGSCSKNHFCGNLNCQGGLDFTKARAAGVGISSMAFGYPGKYHGKFRRYYIRYNTQTDSVTVGTRYTECDYYDSDTN